MEPSPSPEQVLANRYRLDSILGASELGVVYAATDLHGDRECAVKLLPAALRHHAAWSTFQQVSRSVAALDVESVARSSDFGVDAALGQPFVVSERISFPSIMALLAGRGPQPEGVWSKALSAFARALDAAANGGVAHGDLKPQNLFFAPEQPSWARVSDFGMLGLRAACPPPSGVAPLGWAALEQIQSGTASRTADVFTLGLLTYSALTGRHYLSSMWQSAPDPQAVLAELLAEHPPTSEHARAHGAELRRELDAWFSRALHRDAGLRFATAGEAASAFAAALGTAPVNVVRASMSSAPRVQGVAAAVAAPLLFQQLPESTLAVAAAPTAAPITPPAARTILASSSANPSSSEPPRSSRPPGYAARRAHTTEHIPGLPPRPPVALVVAAGAGLLLFVALAAFFVFRFFLPAKHAQHEASPNSSVSKVAEAPAALPPASVVPAPAPEQPLPRTGAHFECIPEACEWIVCDGENVKKGTIDLPLSPGKHSCSASRYGSRTAVAEFVVQADQVTRVPFELLPSKGASGVRPTTRAPRARPASKPPAKSAPAKSIAGAAAKPAASAAKPGSQLRGPSGAR